MNEIDQGPTASGEPVTVPVAAPEPEPLPPEPVPPAPRRVEAGSPSLVELLLNPRRFFEALEARPVSLRVPFLIVLVAGIFGAMAAYLVSSVLLNAMAIPGVEGLGGVFGAIGAISALIIALLFWVIYTAVFFVISMAFKGRGDFNRLLSYVGYGHLPQIFGGIISLALTWNYVSNLRIPPLTDPQQIVAWTATLTKNPTIELSAAIGILFLLWSANIWIFGVRSGRNLSTRDAAITVGVPVLLYILYTVFTLVA